MNETAPRVIKIPAKPESEWKTDAQRQLRVAAYCRVSTKEEDQANSYEAQKEYYTDKIMSNPAWTMAGIFADKGITGTSVKKREDFMRMIRHCRQKKIDVVLTKSVSRFARNTVDCLYYTRALKELRATILAESREHAEADRRIKDAAGMLENAVPHIAEWDESAIRQLVAQVKVLSKNEISVTLKSGIEIRQSITN